MSITYEELTHRFERAIGTGEPSSPSVVAPHLFLSSLEVARDRSILQRHEIAVVINCMGSAANTGQAYYGDRVLYIELPLEDVDSCPIQEHFEAVDTTVRDATRARRNVLVHCSAGVSRSATLVLAHLMISNSWSLKEAYNVVFAARPFILPNRGFYNRLIELEATTARSMLHRLFCFVDTG